MPSANYFRSSAVSEIIKTIKKFPNIDFEHLINKLSVNPPFVKENTARELLKALIKDGQVAVNENGETSVC